MPTRSHTPLSRYYADCTQPLDLERFEDAHRIMEAALDGDRAVLIDLPAQSQRLLPRWIEDNDVLALCDEMQIPVVYWYLVDDPVDSVQLIGQSWMSTAKGCAVWLSRIWAADRISVPSRRCPHCGPRWSYLHCRPRPCAARPAGTRFLGGRQRG